MRIIVANSVNRHICHFKNSKLGHDLPSPVNGRVIFAILQGFSCADPESFFRGGPTFFTFFLVD